MYIIIIFLKKGWNFSLILHTLRFSFFISCQKKVFKSDRLEAKTKIALTWHVQNEWTNKLAGYISKRNEYNCKNTVPEQTYPGLRHLWGSFFQTLNKDCRFVHFILRQMISRCWVCVFGPSHWPSRLGSYMYMKICLDLTFPPKRVSGIMRAEDFAEL